VEFGDGTTYGISDWGGNLGEARAGVMQPMHELVQAYQSGGENALRTTLAQELTRPGNLAFTRDAPQIFDHPSKADGAEALISKIKERLRVA
jgi:hypothetical protein